MVKMPEVIIYTDGACEPNPGKGGWAALLLYKDHIKELVGSTPKTTNNRMELTAAIKALEALKKPCRVTLYTDSQYLMKGITEWIHRWKRSNWKRGNAPVLNADLWRKLDQLANQHQVTWVWVQGHSGNDYNERCDTLAHDEIKKLGNA